MADIDVIPGIFADSWETVEQMLEQFSPHSQWVHVDVTDGTLTQDLTPWDADTWKSLIDKYRDVSFEAHLMVTNPEKYIHDLVDAGFTRLVVHIESNDPRRVLDEAKYDEVEVGIAIDGATEVEQVEPFLDEVDFAVVLTKEIGTQGPFLPEAAERIRLIRQNFPDLPIEAVGGIDETNVKTVREAGATRLVSMKYLLRHEDDIAGAIRTLQSG